MRGYIDMIFMHLFKSAAAGSQVAPVSCSSWSPPPHGLLLLSADAAVSLEHNASAVGVVMQDHTGRCVAAASEPLPGVSSPELAEALALRRVAALPRQKNYMHVIFQYDCLSVIQRLLSSTRG